MMLLALMRMTAGMGAGGLTAGVLECEPGPDCEVALKAFELEFGLE